MKATDVLDVLEKYKMVEGKIFNIIKETYDCNIISITGIDYDADEGEFAVGWDWVCRNCRDCDFAYIPVEWLEDGFDYKAAYEKRVKNG